MPQSIKGQTKEHSGSTQCAKFPGLSGNKLGMLLAWPGWVSTHGLWADPVPGPNLGLPGPREDPIGPALENSVQMGRMTPKLTTTKRELLGAASTEGGHTQRWKSGRVGILDEWP